MLCLIVGCCWIEQVSEQIQKAFKMAGIQGDQSLNQYDFVEVYRKAVLALAECLKGNPLTVAHTEKTFDGSSITALLKDKPALDAVSISNSTKQNKTEYYHPHPHFPIPLLNHFQLSDTILLFSAIDECMQGTNDSAIKMSIRNAVMQSCDFSAGWWWGNLYI